MKLPKPAAALLLLGLGASATTSAAASSSSSSSSSNCSHPTPSPSPYPPSPPLPHRELYRFPPATVNGTNTSVFIENVAVRSTNGHLLLSTFDRARVYSLDPHHAAEGAPPPRAVLVADLAAAAAAAADDDDDDAAGGVEVVVPTGCTEIAEIAPDLFAVTAGVNGEGYDFVPGSMGVWIFGFSASSSSSSSAERPAPTAADNPPPTLLVPSSAFPDPSEGSGDPLLRGLNGLCALPWNPRVLLSADSWRGAVYRIDTETGEVSVSVASEEHLGPGGEEQGGNAVPLGVNGVYVTENQNQHPHHRHPGGREKGTLWFANSGQGWFGRVAVDRDGYAIPTEEEGGGGGQEVALFERVSPTPPAPPEPGVLAFDDFDVMMMMTRATTGVGKSRREEGEGVEEEEEEKGEMYAFVGNHPNAVDRISLGVGGGDNSGNSGTYERITYFGGGDSTVLESPTSVAVSRDGSVLYVVTGAGAVVEIPVVF